MKINEYIPLALRTESSSIQIKSTVSLRLLHSAMGISTEVAELVNHSSKANMKEELGDIAWYCAIGMDAASEGDHPKDIESKVMVCDVGSMSDMIKFLLRDSGELLDIVKRHLFYAQTIDRSAVRVKIHMILILVNSIAAASGVRFGDVLKSNIAKLKARYPDRFTNDRAINRDLEKESNALRGIK
jgi:hypothetical protein